MTLFGRLRTYFLAGCLVTAPVAVTLWLTWLLLGVVDGWLDALVPAGIRPNLDLPFAVPGIGLVVMAALLTLIGMLTAGWIGARVVRLGDWVMTRTPFLKSIYGTAKQVFEAVLSERKGPREVVAFEYPRPGSWTLAFRTGGSTAEMRAIAGRDLIAVFVPTTPNPTAGYLIYVDPEETVTLDMSAEDAVKLVVSGGIWKPGAKTGG